MLNILLMASVMSGALSGAAPNVIVETDAYRWEGDTIFQSEFKAWAVSPEEIQSTYKGRPGYFMPVEQTWKRRNDLSSYPRLTTGNKLHEAIFNMGLDEMVNAVEPDTTLRTGKEWAGVWTRDVSYSIILSMAALQPEASKISLMKKVNPSGQIIQDTGSGGAWPVSTDRMVWTLAAWEIYKTTGDRKWIEKVYPIVVRSLEKDEKTVFSNKGLVKGETSFIDWREQSYPRWMQTADISQSEAMNTNMMYAAALKAASDMAAVLGKKKESSEWLKKAEALGKIVDDTFWMDDKGYHGMFTYGPDGNILNPRAESLGESLGILYDITPADKQMIASQSFPQTPFGVPIFYPQISDMPSYHNNGLWPFVASFWTLAQAKAGNEDAVLQGIGSVFRPAALFATNKENLNLDNGDFFTELNSSNMLWSLSGNLAITMRILFGIHYEKDGLLISPFVPETLKGVRTLENLDYRGKKINITVEGFGANVKSITLNGRNIKPGEVIAPSSLKSRNEIMVVMDDVRIPEMKVNNVANLKAPLTPVAWFETEGGKSYLRWNPIEYIGSYEVLLNGHKVGTTRTTSWDASAPGVWQVVGISGDGTPSFASQPRDNRLLAVVEMPGEGLSMVSDEISYPATEPSAGYSGQGFVEVSGASSPLEINVTVDEAGDYDLSVIYANGNGPVNTENKAAVRSVAVDGEDAGTLIMPHRGVGNWNDWGESNSLKVSLLPGNHLISISYMPEDENMNIVTNHALIDRLQLRKR
ncbi:MAG: hypothetical protein K2N03_05680 [Muribaculaceae bacterium]|nr:hypothetical protein [Muribaculaceae bacterium]